MHVHTCQPTHACVCGAGPSNTLREYCTSENCVVSQSSYMRVTQCVCAHLWRMYGSACLFVHLGCRRATQTRRAPTHVFPIVFVLHNPKTSLRRRRRISNNTTAQYNAHALPLTRSAQVVAGASVLFIVASVISFCLKTHPGFRNPDILLTPTAASGFDSFANLSASSSAALDQNSAASAAAAAAAAVATQLTTEAASTSTTSTSTTTTTTPTTSSRQQQLLIRGRGANRISTRFSSYVGDGWQDTYGQPHEAFFYVELVCNVWFFIELIIRFVVS